MKPRHAFYVQHVLVGTFAFGLFLHGAALIAGREWLLEKVLTPLVDVALLIPICYATVVLWRLRREAQHPNRWHRRAYFAVTCYMAISAAVHVETLLTWEVGYVDRFPEWYSAVVIPVQIAMLLFAARLRFAPEIVRVVKNGGA